MMKDNVNYIELLEQYRKRSLSPAELQALQEWLDSDEGEDTCAGYMDELLKASDIPAVGAEKAYRHILGRIKKHLFLKSLSRFRSALFKVASVLLLAGTAFAYRAYVENRETVRSDEMVFRVDKGNKVMLTLADGSKVWLNSESTLACSKDDVRQVTLEGEAYFEVKKDKEHCFEVHTSYGTVRVYGTSFNVRGRSRDSLFVVSLVEGSIGLQLDGSDKEIKLHPDEMACYDPKQDRLQLVEKDLSAAGLWRQSGLKLADVDTPTLWSRMGDWYSMSFHVKNMPVKKHLYNVTIQTESVEEMLELVNAVTPIEYIIKEKEVSIIYK